MADDGGHMHAGHGCEFCEERGESMSLFRVIDTNSVRTLNEEVEGSGAKVFKAYEERFNEDGGQFVVSDADEQLIIFIPFTANVKVMSFCIMGGGPEEAPLKVKLFAGADDIDFDNVEERTATQEWECVFDAQGVIDYQTRVAKFSNLACLTMFIETNHGADETKVVYIGLQGEYTEVNRKPPVVVYELNPQMADHKNAVQDAVGRTIQ